MQAATYPSAIISQTIIYFFNNKKKRFIKIKIEEEDKEKEKEEEGTEGEMEKRSPHHNSRRRNNVHR